MWAPPVAEVVIDTCPTLSLLLQRIAQSGHIAIIVVTPCQGHIFRNLQSILQYLQYFLVRYKLLWNGIHLAVDILAEHHPLVVYHLLQRCRLFFELLSYTFHFSIVDSTHTYGVDIFIFSRLLQSFNPIVLHIFPVSEIIIGTTLFDVPFPHIIAHHRFAMACTDNDAAGVGHLLRSRDGEEWC